IHIKYVRVSQNRPLTRYLPTKDPTLDLVTFITSCGHNVDQCRHVMMTSSSCRGLLTKMTEGLGGRMRSWKKRWFVFDRSKKCLSYYVDSKESKPPRNIIYFQSIEDVFVDHLHQVNSPTPQLTFCLKTFDRMYYFVAASSDAMRIWIDVLFTGAEGHQNFL
ncbi:hypothetical protein HELRODRAFT_73847, partial [Helobdella robusta]|uniref:PH domain-containing protein n=1 Tax=Helobdella robusta TaxID=6412 RepID=T1G1J3_HELRO